MKRVVPPLNYAALAPVLLTPSVLIFGFERSGTRLLRWLQRFFGVMFLLGAWLFFTTILVLHENWGCYKSQDIHDTIYGRCSVRSARIRRMPELQEPQKSISIWHHWTDTERVFIGVFIGIAVLNLAILVTRLVVIRLDLAILSLPRYEDLHEDYHTKPVEFLLEEAHLLAEKIGFFRPKPDQALVHLAHRLRFIMGWDPVSFVLCLPAVALHLSGLHVVAQISLCATAAGTVATYLATSAAAWKFWVMVIVGGFAFLIALVHHFVVYVRLLHHIDTAKPMAEAALNAASATKSTDYFSHVHRTVSASLAAVAV